MTYLYRPNLRSKSGEAVALENLTPSAKGRIHPIIRLVQEIPAGFVAKITKAFSGCPVAVDGLFSFNTVGSASSFTSIFKQLGAGGVHVTPVVELSAPLGYINGAKKLIGLFANGLIVRVSPVDLSSVNAWVAANGWAPSDIDLIIDAGDVAAYKPDMLAKVILSEIGAHVGTTAGWRTVTLAASAAPKDHGALPIGRTDVPRHDWRLWQLVAKAADIQVDYGDYGVAHPDLTEPPGIAMARATVSVRYTVEDHWIVIKGRPQSGRTGLPMSSQYRSHAKALVADPNFDHIKGCWADDRIVEIATGKTTAGNRTTWVQNSVNRHISLVTHQLP